VEYQLGSPTKVSKGAWGNTRALLYEDVVPGQASLGFLFDPSSGRLRQSEASFDPSADVEAMRGTLSQMLSNNVPPEVQQGLESVHQRQASRYRFVSGRNGRLKGVIERNNRDRIYIAVWEADLH
jgi:serine/threonine-protein kinase